MSTSYTIYEPFPIFCQIQKGIASARSDDTKSLKGVVLDWITPRDTPLHPPLSRNIKMTRGFHHPVTGALLCPAGLDWNDAELVLLLVRILFIPLICWFRVRAKLSSGEMAVRGDQWPMVVYANQEYDPEEPWEGLFRSQLLVWVGMYSFSFVVAHCCLQAYKHIFTSPTSVEKEVKATRSGNARIHGMTRVTTASLAYVATQVRPVFLVTLSVHN
jgi:hypothetical protein